MIMGRGHLICRLTAEAKLFRDDLDRVWPSYGTFSKTKQQNHRSLTMSYLNSSLSIYLLILR